MRLGFKCTPIKMTTPRPKSSTEKYEDFSTDNGTMAGAWTSCIRRNISPVPGLNTRHTPSPPLGLDGSRDDFELRDQIRNRWRSLDHLADFKTAR